MSVVWGYALCMQAERWEVLEGQLLAELAATRHANKAAAKAVRLGGNDLPRHDYMQSGHRGGGSGSGGRGDNSGAQRELMELRREVDGLRQALHAERMNRCVGGGGHCMGWGAAASGMGHRACHT